MKLKKIFSTIFPDNLIPYLQGTLYAFQIAVGISTIITAVALSNSWNPLLSRTGYGYASHTLVWIIIGISIIIIRLKTPWNSIRLAIYSLSASLAALGITEGIWQLSTVLFYRQFFMITLSFNLEIVAMIVTFIIIGAYRLLNYRRFAIYMLTLVSFFAVWLLTGFHITLSFMVGTSAGQSIYYNDYLTNAIEIMHWVIGAFGFTWVYRGRKNG